MLQRSLPSCRNKSEANTWVSRGGHPIWWSKGGTAGPLDRRPIMLLLVVCLSWAVARAGLQWDWLHGAGVLRAGAAAAADTLAGLLGLELDLTPTPAVSRRRRPGLGFLQVRRPPPVRGAPGGGSAGGGPRGVGWADAGVLWRAAPRSADGHAGLRRSGSPGAWPRGAQGPPTGSLWWPCAVEEAGCEPRDDVDDLVATNRALAGLSPWRVWRGTQQFERAVGARLSSAKRTLWGTSARDPAPPSGAKRARRWWQPSATWGVTNKKSAAAREACEDARCWPRAMAAGCRWLATLRPLSEWPKALCHTWRWAT